MESNDIVSSDHYPLDHDEAAHAELVAGEALRNLDLANNAALLALNGLTSAEDTWQLSEPQGLISLLLAKTAQNIRYAVMGLQVGYYSGASAVLRSAFESLAFASLFQTDPSQVSQWLRNEFSHRPDVDALRANQLKAAKRAVFDQEDDMAAIKEGVSEFWRNANEHIHATIRGIAEEFGVDVLDLVPDDFEEAYPEAGRDFDMALDTYVLLHGRNIVQKPVAASKAVPDDGIMIYLAVRFDEPTVTNLSVFALYIAHRLLDSTKEGFTISDREFTDGYRAWHREIRAGRT